MIGFVLGAFFIFYSLPWIENTFGDLHRPELAKLLSSNDNIHPSNIINSMPPVELENLKKTELGKAALSMAYNLEEQDWYEPASKKLRTMVGKIAAQEPKIRQQLTEKLPDGLTNIEAFVILNEYFTRQET